MTVKNTALPVRKAPSPKAEITDWPARLRTSGVGPTILVSRSRSRRASTIAGHLATSGLMPGNRRPRVPGARSRGVVHWRNLIRRLFPSARRDRDPVHRTARSAHCMGPAGPGGCDAGARPVHCEPRTPSCDGARSRAGRGVPAARLCAGAVVASLRRGLEHRRRRGRRDRGGARRRRGVHLPGARRGAAAGARQRRRGRGDRAPGRHRVRDPRLRAGPRTHLRLPRRHHLRRLPGRPARPGQPPLPAPVRDLHQLRPALHDHHRAPVRPAGHDDGRLRDVRGLRGRVRRPGRPPLPRPDGLLPRLRAAAAAWSHRPTRRRTARSPSPRRARSSARAAIVAVKGIGGYHLACDATNGYSRGDAAQAQAARRQAVRGDGHDPRRRAAPRRPHPGRGRPADQPGPPDRAGPATPRRPGGGRRARPGRSRRDARLRAAAPPAARPARRRARAARRW